MLAIAGASLAAIGNAAVTWIDGTQERAVAAQRAETELQLETQRAESARILEMIKSDDPSIVRNNLSFLLAAGLISDERLSRDLETFLNEAPDSQIPQLPQTASEVRQGGRSLHVLTVGISDYESMPDLNNAETDADAVANLFASLNHKLYDTVRVQSLLGERATFDAFRASVMAMANRVDPTRGDVVVIYYAGHGGLIEDDLALIPWDARFNEGPLLDPASVMPVSRLADLLAPVAARSHVLLMIDACAVADHDSPTDTLGQYGVSLVLAAAPGAVCFDGDLASPFARAMIQAVSPLADSNDDGMISISEFAGTLRSETLRATAGEQDPLVSVLVDGVVFESAPWMSALEQQVQTTGGASPAPAATGGLSLVPQPTQP